KLQTQLIEDSLDVSRILQGKLSFSAAPVDLKSTIQAAMETVRLAAEAKEIQIQTQFDPDVGSVSGDAGRLQQVVWNLLSNAVKFTPQGGQVRVTLEQTAAQAQIQVSDTGNGIAPEFLPYVFDRFRQADSKTTRKFGGLGLGLAIVRQLVELHGGTAHVDSAGEGQGTTFTVRLPLTAGETKSIIGENLHAPASIPQPLQGVRVLVVDDETDARELLGFVLQQAGAIVTLVSSAIEALHTLERTAFDLLISDIGMPEMDGYMLIKQIRAMSPERGGTTAAIALTAYAGEFDQQQAIAAGFQQHLAKPVEPNQVINLIADLFADHHTVADAKPIPLN
ncbi:MAG: response regulator, partial [Microcoleus sp. SIO2G3]|nr:response regulator [Microcoleus sp. SIO2G3]